MNTAILIFVLILNAVMLYFAYRFYNGAQTLLFRRRIKTLTGRVKWLEAKIQTISEFQIKSVTPSGGSSNQHLIEPKTPANNFQRMEDRYAEQSKEIVAVNGELVEIER